MNTATEGIAETQPFDARKCLYQRGIVFMLLQSVLLKIEATIKSTGSGVKSQ